MTLLLQNGWVCTLDDSGAELADGWVLVRDGLVEAVVDDAPPAADEVVDLRGGVVTPGLVNTHHHLYQTLTRARAQEATLFEWLRELYPVCGRRSTRRRSTRLLGVGWRSSRCPAARPSSTTTTSSRAAAPGSGRRRCRPRASSACASSPPAGRWTSASRTAGCRRTRWSSRSTRCSRTQSGSPVCRTRTGWCSSRSRPARRSR